MKRHQLETLIKLGSVSGDTLGDDGIYWELSGLQRHPGLSNC